MMRIRSILVSLLVVGGGASVAGAAALTLPELERIYVQAADRAMELEPTAVISIVDRDGRELLTARANGGAAVTAEERARAVSRAGTGVFLSSNQHAFSSRTAGFIIQPNFPPGVKNRPPGPLVGVGFSNLAYSDVNFFSEVGGGDIPETRLNGSPGGVPLYQNGELVAGIGVTGDGTNTETSTITGADVDEAIALAGQIGFAPRAEIWGSRIFLDGIRLPYIASPARLAAVSVSALDPLTPAPPAAVVWPTEVLGGVRGQVRAPIIADPLPGLINGQARLTEAEVRQIIAAAAARTRVTRAGIRLPYGQAAQVFIAVVNNPAQAGVAPTVLGTFRTPDATIFSWDVAVQKARTAVFFSSDTRAYSSRAVGFLAQDNFPPGITGRPPGPLSGLQLNLSLPILTGMGVANDNLPNGITIFPGGFPLYRNGVLVGAIGVSGDGIEQDDIIAASGTVGLQPGKTVRADYFTYNKVRLPYAKFPRDAELRPGVAPVTTGFGAFQERYFTEVERTAGVITGEADDPDADGLSNLLEYAYGRDPRVADAAGALPVETLNGGTNRLEIAFVRVPSGSDLVYTVEVFTAGQWKPMARSTRAGPTKNAGTALSVTETGVSPIAVTVVDKVVGPPVGRTLRVTVTRL